MKIKVNFRIQKMPIIYRHRFVALIKEALNISNPDQKDILYPPKNSQISKKPKPFTFSIGFPADYKIKEEKFKVDENKEIKDIVFYFNDNSLISFYLSTNDYLFLMSFYNGMIKLKEFQFFNNTKLKLLNIILLNEKRIFEEEVNFITKSPILIEDVNEKPIIPAKDLLEKFNENLNSIQNKIFKDLRGYGLKKNLEFFPVKIKKQVVKHTFRGFREKTGKPYMTLTCFEGSFMIRGAPEDLNMLYQIGIGLRRGQGFGMVEIL